MKLLVISGSPRRRDSHRLSQRFLEELRLLGEVDCSEVQVCKQHIEYCCGCLACMRKGESACPRKDELPSIVEAMHAADAVVFAAPVYVHSLPAPLKNFFDRLAWCLHRPAFHGKPACLLSTTELSGLRETLDQLAFPVQVMGFRVLERLGVLSAAYAEEGPYRQRIDERLQEAALKLHHAVQQPLLPTPSLPELALFQKLRTKILMHRSKYKADYEHWKQQGWLEADYFYPVKVAAPKLWLARLPVRMIRFVLRRKLGDVVYRSFCGLDDKAGEQPV